MPEATSFHRGWRDHRATDFRPLQDLVEQVGDSAERCIAIEQVGDGAEEVAEQVAGARLGGDVEHDATDIYLEPEQVHRQRP